MPQSEELSVKFIGDDGNLTKSLGALQDQLKRFEKGLKDADNATSFNRIQRAITETKSRIDFLQRANGQLGNSFGQAIKGSNEATQSLINLSRVAQDAPYGFLGIANNLNPLLESFQRLSAETGSAKTAFAALGSSLVGPAGIGLALGVASSLLVTFGGKLFDSKTEAEQLTEEIRKLGEAADRAGQFIGELKGELAFGNTLGKLNLQIAGRGDTDILNSEIRRIEGAIERLRAAKGALDQTQSELISRSVTAKFGSDEAKEIETQSKKIADAIQKNNDEVNDLIGQQVILRQQITLSGVEKEREAAEETRKKREAEHKKNLAQLKKQFEEEQKINEQRRLAIKQFLNAPIEDGKGNEDFRDMMRRNIIEINPSEKLTELRPRVDVIPNIKIDPSVFKNIASQINELLAPALASLKLEAAFSLGDAIGKALTGGDVGSAFQGFASALGSVIQQLGRQILQLSPLMQAVKLAIKAFKPAAAFAAGLGLIALGGAIKSATSVKGFAQGGLTFGPTLGLVGEGRRTSRSNPEVIAPLDQLKNFIGSNNGSTERLVTRVSGNDLELLLVRTGKSNRRGG